MKPIIRMLSLISVCTILGCGSDSNTTVNNNNNNNTTPTNTTTTTNTTPMNCGNGVIDEGETCDGENLGATCESRGLFGVIACDENCNQIVECGESYCGDGIVSGSEECDWNQSPLSCEDMKMGTALPTVSPTCIDCKIDKKSCDTPIISVGESNAGVLYPDGSTKTWGYGWPNADGQGHEIDPVNDAKFRNFNVAHFQACGVQLDGSILCWGENSSSQSGYDVDGRRGFLFYKGRKTAANQDFVNVAAGRFFSCGLKTDGAMFCWGIIRNGLEGKFESLVADNNICGLKADGAVVCALRYLKYEDYLFTQISAGKDQVCGVTKEGEIICWGCSDCEAEVEGNDFVQVATGGARYLNPFVCGIKQSRKVQCFTPPLRNGAVAEIVTNTPSDVEFIQIDAGEFAICGIKVDGGIQCWGGMGGSDIVDNAPER